MIPFGLYGELLKKDRLLMTYLPIEIFSMKSKNTNKGQGIVLDIIKIYYAVKCCEQIKKCGTVTLLICLQNYYL